MLTEIATIAKHMASKRTIESFEDDSKKIVGWELFILILLIFLGILRIASSTIVAYRCNYDENIIIKIIIVLFAFLFSEIYVPYYLIKYVILNRRCSDNLVFRKRVRVNKQVNNINRRN